MSFFRSPRMHISLYNSASANKLLNNSTKLPNIRYTQNKIRRSFFSTEANIFKRLWSIGRLNHIAIAVPDLEKATAFYRDVLSAKVSSPLPLPEHGVTTVFVELDNTKIELLLPLGDKSPIEKFLQKNKTGGMHHVCLEVDNLPAAVESVRAAGVRCLSPEARIGAHGKPVMFLHPADCGGVLIELEEA